MSYTEAAWVYRERIKAAKQLLGLTHSVNSACIDGIDGRVVEVQSLATEVLRESKPWHKCVSVSGMPSAEVADMLIRVGGALAACGYPQSDVHITVNLHKEADGAALDFPIAMVLLMAAGHVGTFPDPGNWLLFGALDVHGELRHTTGALALCMAARNGQNIVFPQANSNEAVLVKAVRDCRMYPAYSLEEYINCYIDVDGDYLPELPGGKMKMEPVQKVPPDFKDIAGHKEAKRALEIAAAGGCACLLVGSPGSGKTLMASALAGILPPLSNEEKVNLSRIWSAAGMLGDRQAVTRRPFRVVHHTCTKQALIGGGSKKIQPGEVTLAHLGVLFLDEIAEFKKDTLEALRQPIEDGCVRISRVHSKVELPSRVSLVAAMNPCPCGYAPNCSCTEKAVQKYQSKISGPLLDRIDLKVHVQPVPMSERVAANSESSESIRRRVVRAMEIQRYRYKDFGFSSNADVPGTKILPLFQFTTESIAEWQRLAESLKLSLRSADRMAKVARTIADLEESFDLLPKHLAEAAQFVAGF